MQQYALCLGPYCRLHYRGSRCNRPEYTPGRSIPGYIMAQANLYSGAYFGLGQFIPPRAIIILRGINWPRPEYTWVESILGRFNPRYNPVQIKCRLTMLRLSVVEECRPKPRPTF